MDQNTKNDRITPPESAETGDELQIHSHESGLEEQQGTPAPPSLPTGPPPFLPSCVCSVCSGRGQLPCEELHVIDAAAARGCHWCSMFSQAIRKAYPPSIIKPDLQFTFYTYESVLDVSPDYVAYHAIKLSLVKEDGDWVYPMSGDEYSEDEKAYLAEHHPLPVRMCNMAIGGNDGSARSVGQAIQWFNKCRHSHPDCGPADPSFRPSRLLELRGPEDEISGPLQVKLVETKNAKTHMEYACLSHCWGGITPVCVTNKTSMQENLDGIPWTKIPRTFQEAMVVAWRLRLKYIWIDSLCIIQGDDEDWRREAAAMASIYSNSSITISAISSANCLQGLYETDPDRFQVHELKLVLPGQRSARVLVYPLLHDVDWVGHRENSNPGQIGPKLPLLQRAWFFQEWHLSPRLLHFTNREIVWQCRCGSLSQYEAFEGHPFPCPAPNRFENAPSTEDDPPPELMTPQLWLKTVETYSSLQLTFREKDILAAISGVAKKTEHFKQGDTYAAGIWLNNLHLGLCWRRKYTDELPRTPRTKEWAAPSWSWASVDGPVRYDSISFFGEAEISDPSFWDKKCDISKVSCIPAGEDTTGPLKDACMTVSGLATECTLEYDLEDGIFDRWSCYITARKSEGLFRANFLPDYDLSNSGKHHLAPGSSLELLYLLSRSGHTNKVLMHGAKAICLILAKSERKKGAYKRVGLLRIENPEKANDMEVLCSRSRFVIV